MQPFKFRGHDVLISTPRILDKDRDPNKFYYSFRHGDNHLIPLSLEPYVLVNYWGTLISDVPLEVEIKLTRKEKSELQYY